MKINKNGLTAIKAICTENANSSEEQLICGRGVCKSLISPIDTSNSQPHKSWAMVSVAFGQITVMLIIV